MATFTKILARIVNTAPAGEWVRLDDLRADLAGWSRAEQDAALRKLATFEDVDFTPEVNRHRLNSATRAAAIRIGGEAQHKVRIG